MKLIPTAHELISNMAALFQPNSARRSYLNEEPLRAELYSSDQMERFGKILAKTHNLSTKAAQDHLLKRLSDNEALLNEVRKLLTESLKRKYLLTPAGEWLIDNFYLIEEHIRAAKMHFPKNYSEDLPQLTEGDSTGLTRIYDIMLQIIAHSDGRMDMEGLSNFVSAYQTVTKLQLGELWAIPIMLRLGLIENIRRVSSRIAIDKVDRNLADYWGEQMLETVEKAPKNLILVIADMARSNPPMVSAFVSELTRQLRGKGPDLALALNWMEQQLSDIGLTSGELVAAENQKQAAAQVSMSNSINSLRLLGSINWRDFVESHSIVDQILREDKEGVYAQMDFATRDRYRHVVEAIAKKSAIPESNVADMAMQLVEEHRQSGDDDARKLHVGYYLIGAGVTETEKLAKMPVSGIRMIQRIAKKHAFRVYVGAILLITLAIGTGFYVELHSETNHTWLVILVMFVALLGTTQLAISIVNFFSTLLVEPHLLARMDFSAAIPTECRTLIVVPAMLTGMDEIDQLVDDLEVRFLANRNLNLHFGLLTDFADAFSETLPEDEELVTEARQRIQGLNKKYQRTNDDLFFFFHRPRRWNPSENVWMGYERKRGKLSELNDLLRGGSKDRFSVVVGDPTFFPGIKYVITLDADTQLPLGSAWKLIGTISHPLNRAQYDGKKKRVSKGYGILQPRVAVSLPEVTSSLYTRMHGNEPGIDPYTRASSDVYQDLFGEGSFIGKGIYEVDMFIKVLDGRFAENSILSHDLLEGCYLRSGLVSDVQLFEKYPGTYRADMKRVSRWVRGDWQIISWIFPMVKTPSGHWNSNPISWLSRWKIFDNIRRSLIPMALTSMILLGWIFLPFSDFWTVAVSGIIVVPIIIGSLWDTIRKPKDIVLMHHIKNSIYNFAEILVRTAYTLVCLPYEAFLNGSAILRALWRMLISRKHLLRWLPSRDQERLNRNTLAASYAVMWIEPFLAVMVYAALFVSAPGKLLIAGPVLLAWLAAPFITWWTSRTLAKQVAILSHSQHIFLKKLARKTWSFFEKFVNQEDNWLPPDNFQEQPLGVTAHRTSPTNIGLSLLANLTAANFGYITTEQCIERISNTIGTLESMERYKGHFYNWYDTLSLQPLLPKYISTVDSGNLVGHLLVLRQGLLAIPHQSLSNRILFEGLRDTLGVLCDALDKKEVAALKEAAAALDGFCHGDMTAQQALTTAEKNREALMAAFGPLLENLDNDPESEAVRWKHHFIEQLNSMETAFRLFEPWVLLEEAPPSFKDLAVLEEPLSLIKLMTAARQMLDVVTHRGEGDHAPSERDWLDRFNTSLQRTIRQGENRINKATDLAARCNDLADIELDFLYHKASNLLTIGYNVQENRCDASYYDLLASEARLCNFIGIAEGKLPEESWFALGRLLTNVNGDPILLSWSGSMFEYLMPLLVMPTYENTLLDQTYKAVVEWQIEYGKQRGIPWGISESGYNMINASSSYQYRAFGAPGLGLKRGLDEDLVIAPYATALALMVAPQKACKNLELLQEKGFEGQYGFYEAIDYTPSRLQRGQSSAIVYSFMAHHQGMSLLSLEYLLLDKPMQQLFEAEPQFRATLLLLQERIPKATSYFAHTTDVVEINYQASGGETRVINTPNTPLPEVHLLSNGKYHVMITNAGGGYSRWKDMAVTRWREDVTCDNWGAFCYIRDLRSDTYWSNTHQPALKLGEKFEAAFSQGRVDFRTTHNDVDTHTEIAVSPEDDIEIRRVHLKNSSNVRRTLEVTSYAEVVMASAASDVMQPAFSNLFVQTEIIPEQHAILCTRRPRSSDEQAPWMFHILAMHGKEPEEISYETDRMEFIGRGNSAVNPKALTTQGPLKGNQGSVLDPVVAIRYKVTLKPGETVTLDMVIGMGESRTVCQQLIGKYQDKPHKDRVFELAMTHAQVVLRQLNASEADAQLYGRLASSILFPNAVFRADPSILINNHRQQSGLWSYSVSGDLPIVLLKIEKQANMDLAAQLVQAHAYWRIKGLAVDLVIWNEEHSGYRQAFQNDIQSLIPAEFIDRPGGIFVRASDQISNEDRVLFQTVARVNISDNGGTLADQIRRKPAVKAESRTAPQEVRSITQSSTYKPSLIGVTLPEGLIFYNGSGGFSGDGKEYVIITGRNNNTPAPWVNVLANFTFGTVVSESGTAYTWTENAHELRLTPWNNDPVSDKGGEAFYLRDEEMGHYWSTSLLPAGGPSPYLTRHGFGYSIFEHLEDGIHSEMTVYVDIEAAVKFTVLKIRNQSGRARKLTATGYTEWVLGDNRVKTAMYIHTDVDPDSGALFARNPYNTEFGNRVGFFDADGPSKMYTADRTEFIGRNGTLQNPEAMTRIKLSGRVGLALDPCTAIRLPVDLVDGEEREIIFRLGAGKDQLEASSLAQQFRGTDMAHMALERIKEFWRRTTGTLKVQTPDIATNMLANGWLNYQTLSSRLWGRSGYYQSGGAFGFRDQLQDVLSLMYAAPELARKQILLCASRQFKEGDVQHWWHPPSGRGVRTRCSDDFLWLPLVTSLYITRTGDAALLDEPAFFLGGRLLNPGEESYYDLPLELTESASVYEHCVRAIRRGYTALGEKGLPLMAGGDWNDGFDKVGNEGKGESVWLAFFLYDILVHFAEVARNHHDPAVVQECLNAAKQLKENINRAAWDGQWYKRAWFDDGTPLGSSVNEECQIDSIAQSWSVLSGAGDEGRQKTAMDSAYARLVRKDARIIQLLEPPFDKSALNPGYIKGYVPGIRENGGQYTHAAVWMIMAFAKLGDSKRVWELLDMINPINHNKSIDAIKTYKVEPYVLAGDVYSFGAHAGRGGWTWYSGSASWMYCLIVESFLGLRQEGQQLTFAPCVPQEWVSFTVEYRYHNTLYHIKMTQNGGQARVTLNGQPQPDNIIRLVENGVDHQVEIFY